MNHSNEPGSLAGYVIDPKAIRRFDERQTIFARRHWDEDASFFDHDYRAGASKRIAEGEPGYSRIDFARTLAAWTVHDCFSGAFSWRRLGEADPAMMQLGQHAVSDPAQMSTAVRETARMFGADLVGITKADERWIYSHNRS